MHDIAAFLRHMLERADWTRDLHFQTQTTIDTLDYSGGGLNAGSKVVIAAVGPQRFELATEVPADLRLARRLQQPAGRAAGRTWRSKVQSIASRIRFAIRNRSNLAQSFAHPTRIGRFRWIVIVDDSQFVAESLRNFLWVTFTRTNPAADIHGIESFTTNKHWGCRGPLVIDARLKPHHAPPLVEDPEVSRRVDALAAPGGPLHGII